MWNEVLCVHVCIQHMGEMCLCVKWLKHLSLICHSSINSPDEWFILQGFKNNLNIYSYFGCAVTESVWTDSVGVQYVLLMLCSCTAAVWVCRSMPTPLGLNSTAGPLTYSLYFFLSLTLTHKRFVRSPSYIKHNFFLDYVFFNFLFFWYIFSTCAGVVAGQAWYVTTLTLKKKQQQQHKQQLYTAGYTLSYDDTAFTQKTNWAVCWSERRTSSEEHVQHLLITQTQGEWVYSAYLKGAGRTVTFPWDACWRIDGSAHSNSSVSAILRPCEHMCCQPNDTQGTVRHPSP